MFDRDLIKNLMRGSKEREAVSQLRSVLYELGFDEELDRDKNQADGDFGKSTAFAVRAFAEKNGPMEDEKKIAPGIVDLIFARFDILDDMRHMQNAVEYGKIERFFRRKSSVKTAVAALQTLLNELGFGAELNWEKFGADGDYGRRTAEALKSFAEKEGIESDGEKLTVGIAEKIIEKLAGYYGKNWSRDRGTPIKPPVKIPSGEIFIRETVEKNRTRIYIADGDNEVRFTRFKKGVYFFGTKKPADFIRENSKTLAKLKGVNDSAVNMMASVAENEGNMDSINTWDNSFITFGMLQWSAGVGSNPGELPALAKKIRENCPGLFEKYYGRHGLDIIDTNEIDGYFALNGDKLVDKADKEILRGSKWSFYFCLAGQEDEIRAVQVQHAFSRIATFYESRAHSVKGYAISDLVTSEYGVGLLLDNHVNRPWYVKECLELAMDVTGLERPETWKTDEERKLIKAYLKIRETYGKCPMTDAKKRADATGRYLAKGIISDERGSFLTGSQKNIGRENKRLFKVLSNKEEKNG